MANVTSNEVFHKHMIGILSSERQCQLVTCKERGNVGGDTYAHESHRSNEVIQKLFLSTVVLIPCSLSAGECVISGLHITPSTA